MMNLNEIEQETLVLNAISDLIGALVNNYNLKYSSVGGLSQVWHSSNDTFKLFIIQLTDFLSPPDDFFIKSDLKGYLSHLKSISEKQENTLNTNKSEKMLQHLSKFETWLHKDFVIENAWLPDIGLETNLTLSRFKLIKLTGNHVKHNISRFSRNISTLSSIFKKSGHNLTSEEIIIGCGYLIDEFFKPIVSYHTSTIAEFLNNIRWEIYEYLQPVFDENYKSLGADSNDIVRYEYIIPEGIESDFSKGLYWKLMNNTRSKPNVPKFTVNPIYKNRF